MPHYRKHGEQEGRLVDNQDFDCIQRFLKQRHGRPYGVFQHDQGHENGQRYPEDRRAVEGQRRARRRRRLEIGVRPQNGDSEEGGDRGAGDGRDGARYLLPAFQGFDGRPAAAGSVDAAA